MINTKGLPMRRLELRWDWEGAQVMVIKPRGQNTHLKQILTKKKKKSHFLQHHFVMRKKLIPGRYCFLCVLWFPPTPQDVHLRWNGMSKLSQCVGVCSAPCDGRMSCPASCPWAAGIHSGHPQLLAGISGLEKILFSFIFLNVSLISQCLISSVFRSLFRSMWPEIEGRNLTLVYID